MLDKAGISCKSTQPRIGPHTVSKTYQNITVKLRRGAITERVAMQHLPQYFS
jgi:hypothetical protein